MTITKFKPFLMWFFPLSFFAYQFILRLWPGLMMPQIMERLSIDVSQFGVLAAFYYYGYAGIQIPVAILLNRFSVQYIICIFAILCGLSTLVFTYTNNFHLAVLCRFLVGAGSAVAFLGVSKVISEWFPKEQYASMIGFSFSFGLMGAIYGGKPISFLIDTYSGRSIATMLAMVSILIGIASYFFLRSPKQSQGLVPEEKFKLANFKALFSSKTIWYLALANLLMAGSLEGFADVWGIPYLMSAYHLEKGDAAGFISFIFFGMLFGGPLLALLSKRLGNYLVIATCGSGVALAFLFLLLNNSYNPIFLCILFFTIGVLCCYQVIVFAAGSNLVEPKNLGIVIAFLNSINMLGGSFFHTSIGKIIDLYSTDALNANLIKVCDLQVYTYALSIIPVCAVTSAFIVIIIAIKAHKKIKSIN